MSHILCENCKTHRALIIRGTRFLCKGCAKTLKRLPPLPRHVRGRVGNWRKAKTQKPSKRERRQNAALPEAADWHP